MDVISIKLNTKQPTISVIFIVKKITVQETGRKGGYEGK